MNFAQSLNYLMDTLEISAYKLSQETKIPQAMIGRWKNGQNPSTENLQKIADFFGVTTDYLIGNESFRYRPTKESLLLRKILGQDYQLEVIMTDTCICKELSNGYILAVFCRSLDDKENCDADAEVWNYDQQPFVHESLDDIKKVSILCDVLREWENKYKDLPPLNVKAEQSTNLSISNVTNEQKEKPAASEYDELNSLFSQLTTENKQKILELARLYAEHQEKK